MDTKKISFGFKKVQKPSDSRLAVPNLAKEQDEKKDYIDCLEENAIKVVGGEVIPENKPLVIPLKPNTLTAERFQQIAEEVESALEEKTEPEVSEVKETTANENETLDQQVVRELLEDAKNVKKEETQVLSLKLPNDAPLTGQKESTLDDYEAVPISDYGMAMLRGMGWTPGQASKYKQPTLRPKGLGLGADKLMKKKDDKKSSKNDANEEELKLIKGAFVRVLAGKYSGAYGKVVSLNDESARVTVELALGRNQVEIGEQLLETVSRDTYNERSRIINSDKYEEYKRKEQIGNDKSHSSTATKSESSNSHNRETYRYQGRNRTENRNYSSDEESYRKESEKPRKRYDSDSDHDRFDSTNNKNRSNGEKYRPNISDSERKSRKSEKESHSRRSPSSSAERDYRKERRDLSSRDKTRKEHDESSNSSSDERRRKPSKNKHRSGKSSTSETEDSDQDKRRKKSKKRSKTPVGKRDIDKKRKGKKKKRDRDRSPNYRKHKR